MAIESLVALGFVTVFLAALALYASKHRAEDSHKESGKHA